MSGLSPAERDVLERCAGEPMLQQVLDWAAMNSGSGNLAGLAHMAELLANAFSGLPGELALRDPAPTEVVDQEGHIQPGQHGRNLHLIVRPEAPVQLLLTGHMDTVYRADHPFQSTHWMDDGTLGGPAVADMKGGLAVILAALKAVETSSVAGSIGYELVINSDEEVGSPGSAALIREAAKGKQAAFTYEPAIAPDGTLAAARPGSGNFAILVRGKSAHAGRNPEEGRNAILAAADIALRLSEAAGPDLGINPARIDGGGPNNVVPDRAVLRVNLRPRSADAQQRAETTLRMVTETVGRERDVQVSLHGGFARPPKPFDPAAERLFTFVTRCGADLGQTIGWRDTGGVCDGNIIAAEGVPVIDTMGVRGGAIHSAEEFLIVDSLVERAQLSALAMMRLAEGERP
jgi:glutamate carboxypeptidase